MKIYKDIEITYTNTDINIPMQKSHMCILIKKNE